MAASSPRSNRPALTEEERNLLTADSQEPFRIEDRAVDRSQIPAVLLQGIQLQGVDFSDVRFSGTIFRDVLLENVTFEDCQFDGVAFEDTTILRSKLSTSNLRDVRFARCTFDVVTTEICSARGGTLEGCLLTSWTDTAGLFEKARWSELQIVDSQLTGTKLSGVEFEEVTITGGSVKGVSLSQAAGHGVLMADTNIDGLEVMLGSLAGLTFERVSGRGIHLTDAQLRGLSFLRCAELLDVAISGGRVDGFAVDNCRTLALLTAGYTSIENLLIDRTSLSGVYLRKSTIAGDSRIDRSTLDGLDFEASGLDGVTISESTIANTLGLVGARISGLALEAVQFAPGLDIVDDGVTYGDGERFPGLRP
jgi:uncharacterized protein YjbI with pentapeptide repeats